MTSPGRAPQGGGHRWPVTALLLLGLGLILSRGGLASLVPLIRALIPVAIVVVIYRVVRNYVQQQIMGPRAPGGRMAGRGQQEGAVIDLCPRCGAYLAPGHRCTKT